MKMGKILAVIVLVILVVTLYFLITPTGKYLQTMPTTDKEILIYTSNSGIELMLEATIPAFTEKTGIKVTYVTPGGSGAVINKIIAEKDSPSADIAIASLPSMLGGKKDDALEKYVSPEAAHIPSVFKDSDGYYTGWYAFHTVLAYNPNLVTTPPEKFTDLLNPEYKGKLAYPDPTTSGNGLRFLAALIKTMGEDEAFEFLADLEPSIARHDSLPLGEFIDKGELWIQVSDDSIITSEVMEEHLTDQFMAVTEEGTIAGFVAIAITKDAPHLEEAKQLIDFMLSEEGQTYVTKGYGYPCRKDMEEHIPKDLANIWEPFFGKPVINLDWEEIAENMEAWKTRWTEEIQPLGR